VRRQPPDESEDFLHRRTAADHAAELEPLGDVSLEREHRAALLRLLPYSREQLTEARQVEWFREEVHGTQLHRLHCGVDGAKPGHEHDLDPRAGIANRAEHLEAGDAGHAEVDQDELARTIPELLHGVFAAHRGGNVEAFSECNGADERQDRPVVVNNQEAWALSLHKSSGTCPHRYCGRVRGSRLL
jgi:hypothetical protein